MPDFYLVNQNNNLDDKFLQFLHQILDSYPLFYDGFSSFYIRLDSYPLFMTVSPVFTSDFGQLSTFLCADSGDLMLGVMKRP